jgi:ATP-binding cassette subfamily B protein
MPTKASLFGSLRRGWSTFAKLIRGDADSAFLKYLLRCLRPYKAAIAIALILLVVSAASELALGKAFSQVIDRGFTSAHDNSIDRHFQILYCLVLTFALATCTRSFTVSWLGERVEADIRTATYNHIIGLSPEFFEVSRSGDLLSRLMSDTTVVRQMITYSVTSTLKSLFIILGGVILLMVTSPKLAGSVLLLVPLAMIPVMFIGRRVRRLSRASQAESASVTSMADETLRAIQTVHAFTQEAKERSDFQQQVQKAFGASVRRNLAGATFSGSMVFLTLTLVTGILWMGARDVGRGAMTAGDLTAFVIYSLLLASSIGSLSEVWSEFQRAAGAGDRIVELLKTQPMITAPVCPVPLPSPPRGTIRFDDVTFSYPTRPSVAALKGFSLEVRAGETVALVGPSGAGKSTVFNLILRFYDPISGRVCFDGVDVRDVEPAELRARLGLVAQDPSVFHTSIAENIRYGRPGATDAEVIYAAGAAAAAEFIERLPQGYDTIIGEGGMLLSGGQRQRLAIARAVLRVAPVILFDEATSSLDSRNEQLVQQALHDVLRDRTAIIIAHRLATVVRADTIVVMDGGLIIDAGSHRELLARCELYDHLARLQFDMPAEMRSPLPVAARL